MDSISAFVLGNVSRGKPLMVFDWNKAAKMMRDQKANYATAGLSRDWEKTGGSILRNGIPIKEEDTHVYLASRWAKPELDIDGTVTPCWKYQDDTDEWDRSTYWPESARAILAG